MGNRSTDKNKVKKENVIMKTEGTTLREILEKVREKGNQ